MNKFLTFLFITTISSTSAFASGFYCESDAQNADGKTYYLEASVLKNTINVIQLNWDIKDDRGHADEYETILEDESLELVYNYTPTSSKFQNYLKFKGTTGDHSLETIEIFIPKNLGAKKSRFLAYVKVIDEHAGLITNETMACSVN